MCCTYTVCAIAVIISSCLILAIFLVSRFLIIYYSIRLLSYSNTNVCCTYTVCDIAVIISSCPILDIFLVSHFLIIQHSSWKLYSIRCCAWPKLVFVPTADTTVPFSLYVQLSWATARQSSWFWYRYNYGQSWIPDTSTMKDNRQHQIRVWWSVFKTLRAFVPDS